ncbi:MAG: hypothetical protein LQ338_007391 [Usnochroma carphineum]|nr:MAG: hypothetical protein LQ338_007391 [Usnochroma carphineum]
MPPVQGKHLEQNVVMSWACTTNTVFHGDIFMEGSTKDGIDHVIQASATTTKKNKAPLDNISLHKQERRDTKNMPETYSTGE